MIRIGLSRLSALAFAMGAPSLVSSLRYQSSSGKEPLIQWIPHQISEADAAKRLSEAAKSLFSPRANPGLSLNVYPLRKVLLPCFQINAAVSKTIYTGQYGILRHEFYIGYGGKLKSRTWTEWHDTKGVLKPAFYSKLFYGGNKWDGNAIQRVMREAMDESSAELSRPFDPDEAAKEKIYVDPFCKPAAIAQEEGNGEIRRDESHRCEGDIHRRHRSASFASVSRMESIFDSFKMSSFLLPAYVLEYPNIPASIVPALNDKNIVEGNFPISAPKCAAAGFAAAAIFSFAFPQAALPIRLAGIASASALSALFGKKYQSTRYYFQESRRTANAKWFEGVNATRQDKERSKMTGSDEMPSDVFPLGVEQKHYAILGLDPKQEICQEVVDKAFHNKIKEAHPDVATGSHEKASSLIASREVFTNALRQRSAVLPNRGKRSFSSLPDKPIKEPPRSTYHPKAETLIRTLLKEENYDEALRLVRDEEISPDVHDKGENTLLTEAAKQGNLKAIAFIIDELGASPDTSCDCPAHRTALHYAAKTKNPKAISLLIEKGANPNLIDLEGKTPLDVAFEQRDAASQEVLIEKGALRHRTAKGVANGMGLFRRLAGYAPKDRTLLMKSPNETAIPLSSGAGNSRRA